MKVMKKNIKYICMVAMLLSVSSCSSFLDVTPEDSRTADNYYNSETDVRNNTASLYGRVWWSWQEHAMWEFGDIMSGELYYTYDQEGQFYYMSFNSGNSYLDSGWKGLYRVISFANSVISDVPSKSSSSVSQSVITQAVAEARFIRGVAYYYLTEYWGEVPIVTNSSDNISNGDLDLNKNNRKSLYKFIISDFTYAMNNLPSEDSQAGRATKWAAEGMLAKVYLTRASAAMGDAATYGDASSDFTKAKDLCSDVITNSGHTLDSDYANNFTVDGNNNSESLFAIQCKSGAYELGNSRNCNFARSSTIADQCWGAGKGPTISLEKAFSSSDNRRKWTYMKQGDYYSMLDKSDGGYTYNNLKTANSETPSDMLAHIKKYVIGKASDCNNNVGTNQDAGNNVHILRLSDVYLMYAEAVLGTSSSTTDATALKYFNAVHHDRAGLTAATSLSFTDILAERRLEFAFEGMRWLDIKRYYYRDKTDALTLLNGTGRNLYYKLKTGYNSALEDDANDNSHYDLVSNTNIQVVISDSQMFLPIPSEALTSDALLGDAAVDYTTTE
jgi:starch-binding outer membrane protein, SusD/RagB family